MCWAVVGRSSSEDTGCLRTIDTSFHKRQGCDGAVLKGAWGREGSKSGKTRQSQEGWGGWCGALGRAQLTWGCPAARAGCSRMRLQWAGQGTERRWGWHGARPCCQACRVQTSACPDEFGLPGAPANPRQPSPAPVVKRSYAPRIRPFMYSAACASLSSRRKRARSASRGLPYPKQGSCGGVRSPGWLAHLGRCSARGAPSPGCACHTLHPHPQY